MDLFTCARLPRQRRVTTEDRLKLRKVEWNPQELIQLKLMNRTELLGLMVFCDITAFNEMPVIACEDDELRMAYWIWRGTQSIAARQKYVSLLEKLKRHTLSTYDNLTWWIGEM